MDSSFIVPLYSGKKFIKKIISMIEKNKAYLQQQGYSKEIEIIFINDNPHEIIEKQDVEISQSISNIVLITNHHNLGIHRTRLKGLEQARGQYIIFLDQDDEIVDEYLFYQYHYIADGDAVLSNGIYRQNKMIYRDEICHRKAVNKRIFIDQQNLIISPGQVMIKHTAIPKEWKNYPLYTNGSDDVFLWILLLRDRKKFSINSFCGYYHIEDGNNISLNFGVMKKSIEELFQVVRENELLVEEDYLIFENAIYKRLTKYNKYIETIENWTKIISSIKELIEREQYPSIAIYGYGVIGQKLYRDLEKLSISVDFFIDRDAASYQTEEYLVYSLEENNKDASLTIITPLFAEDEIRKSLREKKGKVISLREFF